MKNQLPCTVNLAIYIQHPANSVQPVPLLPYPFLGHVPVLPESQPMPCHAILSYHDSCPRTDNDPSIIPTPYSQHQSLTDHTDHKKKTQPRQPSPLRSILVYISTKPIIPSPPMFTHHTTTNPHLSSIHTYPHPTNPTRPNQRARKRVCDPKPPHSP